MRRLVRLIPLLCLMAMSTARAQTPVDPSPLASFQVERTLEESNTAVILFGRACRASSDTDWFDVCAAAVGQAAKELGARKPKPVPEAPSPPVAGTPAP